MTYQVVLAENKIQLFDLLNDLNRAYKNTGIEMKAENLNVLATIINYQVLGGKEENIYTRIKNENIDQVK